MKLFTQKKVTAYLIGLLFLFSVSGNAQHFGNVNGDATGDTWTAYLDYVTLDGNAPDANDELGIYDGNTLVGVYTFDGNENDLDDYDNSSGGSGQTDYPTVCFSDLTAGNGYDAGNVITFKFWDDSEGLEITATSSNITFLNYGGNEYVDNDGTPNFPPGDGEFSFMKLEFDLGYSVSGTVTLDGCEGDVTNVLVSVYDDDNDNLVGTDYPDSNGDYAVGGIQDDSYLEATLENYESYTSGTFTGDYSNYNFTLNPYQGSITVEVRKAENSDPINQATVKLYDSDNNIVGTDNSGNSGIYAFGYGGSDWLCMDDYYAEITHNTYEGETTSTVAIDENGQSETITAYLYQPSGSVSGYVTDANTGDPISSANVYSFNYNVDPPENLIDVYTDSDGYYSYGEVPAGTWHFVVEAAEYKTDSVAATINSDQNNNINIALTPSPGALEGTVRKNSGNGPLLPGVTVNVIGANTTPLNATTNSSGIYSFSEVPAGTHDVEFSKGGFETTTVQDVTITPNGTTTANANMDFAHGQINVNLVGLNEYWGGGATNEGEATVKIGDDYTATYNSNNDDYRLTSIPEGQYDITIEHPDYHNGTIKNVQVVSDQWTTKTYDMMEYHWTLSGGNSMESVWTLYFQQVTMDGNAVEHGDEIAIYDDLKKVGVYYVNGNITPGNATNQDMRAYSELNNSDGYAPGNDYSFKLYDRDKDQTFALPEVTLSDPNNEGAYTGNVFPSGMAPFSYAKLDFFSNVDIEFQLQEGYQLISSRVETDNMDMGNIFSGSGIWSDLEFVRNEDGLPFRQINGTWVNNIGDWKVTEGYLVKMSGSFTHTITGTPVNPQKKIYLKKGYNIISYLPATPMNADVAFTDIQDNLDFVRNSEGKHYWEIGGQWVNNIGNLELGEGYLVKMSAEDSLVYPTTKGALNNTDDQKPQHFTFDGGNAKENVYTVYINSDDLEPGDEVAAFDGDKMVGSTVISSNTEGKDNDLNIFKVIDAGEGYQPGNEVTFKVWSPRTGNEYSNVEKEYLDPNNEAYTSNTFPENDGEHSIVKLSVNELGIGDQAQKTGINVYPNPADKELNINSEKKITEIKIANMVGQTLIHKRVDNDNYTINVSDLEPGLYILETTINGHKTSLRFIAE